MCASIMKYALGVLSQRRMGIAKLNQKREDSNASALENCDVPAS
jgi:hypothetical protein